MSDWSFLTNHARALLFVMDQPDGRLRDLASALDITERTAYSVVADLTKAGYVVKQRDGRRNRYHVQEYLPLRDAVVGTLRVGDVLRLLAEARDPSDDGSVPIRPRPSSPQF